MVHHKPINHVLIEKGCDWMERVWCGLDVVHSVFDMVSPTLVLHSFCPNKPNKEEEKEFESEKGMVKDQRHRGW